MHGGLMRAFKSKTKSHKENRDEILEVWWINLALKVNQAKGVWEGWDYGSILASGCDVCNAMEEEIVQSAQRSWQTPSLCFSPWARPVNQKTSCWGKEQRLYLESK